MRISKNKIKESLSSFNFNNKISKVLLLITLIYFLIFVSLSLLINALGSYVYLITVSVISLISLLIIYLYLNYIRIHINPEENQELAIEFKNYLEKKGKKGKKEFRNKLEKLKKSIKQLEGLQKYEIAIYFFNFIFLYCYLLIFIYSFITYVGPLNLNILLFNDFTFFGLILSVAFSVVILYDRNVKINIKRGQDLVAVAYSQELEDSVNDIKRYLENKTDLSDLNSIKQALDEWFNCYLLNNFNISELNIVIKEYYESILGLEEMKFFYELFHKLKTKLKYDKIGFDDNNNNSKDFNKNFRSITETINSFNSLLKEHIDNEVYTIEQNRKDFRLILNYLSIVIALITLILGILLV